MMSAPLLRFMSKDRTSHPCSLKALPMDPVPEKSSSSLISLPHEKIDSSEVVTGCYDFRIFLLGLHPQEFSKDRGVVCKLPVGVSIDIQYRNIRSAAIEDRNRIKRMTISFRILLEGAQLKYGSAKGSREGDVLVFLELQGHRSTH